MRREIIKIRAEISELETRNTAEHINETRNWFFERINKFNKLLVRLISKRKEKGPKLIKL